MNLETFVHMIMVKNVDTSLFVQKPSLKFNYIESFIQEDLDLKNQYKIENLPCPVEISDAACKSYVDSGLMDPNILANTAHVNFNDKNLDNVRFRKLNSVPAVREDLKPKLHVDEAIPHRVDESSILRIDPNEKSKLDEQDSTIHNFTLTSPRTDDIRINYHIIWW